MTEAPKGARGDNRGVADFPNDELVRVLSRETPYDHVAIQRVVNMLRALGWDAYQIRRGVNLIAGSHGLLTLQALIKAAELAGGHSIDEVLDALIPKPRGAAP